MTISIFVDYTYRLTLVVIVLHLSSFANATSNREQKAVCYSSCGNLTNITYPSRLRGDPPHCGKKKYELVCVKNRTTLHYRDPVEVEPRYPSEPRAYVEAINYNNYTVRVVDVGIQRGNCSSLPLGDSFSADYWYGDELQPENGANSWYAYDLVPATSVVVVLLDCENPVVAQTRTNLSQPVVVYKEAILPTTTDSCDPSFFSNGSNDHSFYYFVFGGYRICLEDIEAGCSVVVSGSVVTAAAKDSEQDKLSFSDFHDKLAFGYEISWISILCNCTGYDERCALSVIDSKMTVYCFVAGCDGRQKHTFKCFLDHVWPKLIHTIEWFVAPVTLCGFLWKLMAIIFKYRRRNLSAFENIEGFLQSNNTLLPFRYSYWQIKRMTKGFRDKLGEGGFSSVYRGKLRSGDIVAIKILSDSNSSARDFVNEVATIGRVHHTNVVRLVGFCVQRSKRALVYEFMPNGSLEKYIFSQEGTTSLSCNQMFDISVGVARAIEYLHRGCEMQILHFDIKPHNILLDQNFNPRVSDFGLAKLYPAGKSMVTLTEARGTMGYIAPEMFYKNIGRVSHKADVYSFGMLLLEMAGRRKNLNMNADKASQIYFPSWVYDELKEGREVEMGETTKEEKKMTKKMIFTAFWCTQMKPSDRPSMEKVVEMLEGDTELLQMPRKPSLNPREIPADVT